MFTTTMSANFELTARFNEESEYDQAAFFEQNEEAREHDALSHLDVMCLSDLSLADALDFETVPFTSVEADLAIALHDQVQAEEREWEYNHRTCEKCGSCEESHKVGRDWYCVECVPASLDSLVQELETKRWERARKKRMNRAWAIKAALVKAKKIAPHLNWGPIEHKLEWGEFVI
jgi:hypothetical protein